MCGGGAVIELPVGASKGPRPSSLQNLAVAVLELRADGSLLEANGAWTALSGLSQSASRGRGWSQALAPIDAERLCNRLRHSASGTLDCPVAFPGGQRWTRWLWDGPDVSGASRIVTIVDLSADHRRETELAARAARDSLTGATNRAHFLDLVGAALRAGTDRVGVVYADLDGFKQVNDTGGHALGDHVLRLVAERLRQHLRADDVLGRVGGDEFAVLCTGPAAELVSVASRMAAALRDPFTVRDVSMTVSATVGVALSDGRERDPEALLARADEAMYNVKRLTPRATLRRGRRGAQLASVVALPTDTVDQLINHLYASALSLAAARSALPDGEVTARLDAATVELESAIEEVRTAAFAAVTATRIGTATAQRAAYRGTENDP